MRARALSVASLVLLAGAALLAAGGERAPIRGARPGRPGPSSPPGTGIPTGVGPRTYAKTVTVAKQGGDFPTLAAAMRSITDASAGKLYQVRVLPGTYAEPARMKSHVDVIGCGADLCTIRSTRGAAVNAVGVQNAVLSGLRIEAEGKDDPAVFVSGTPVVRDCVLRSAAGAGFVAHSPGSRPQLTRCVIDAQLDGVRCKFASPTIMFCTVLSRAGHALYCNETEANVQMCHLKAPKAPAIYCEFQARPRLSLCRIETGQTGLFVAPVKGTREPCTPLLSHCTIDATTGVVSSANRGGSVIHCTIRAKLLVAGVKDGLLHFRYCDMTSGHRGMLLERVDEKMEITNCHLRTKDYGVRIAGGDMFLEHCTIRSTDDVGVTTSDLGKPRLAFCEIYAPQSWPVYVGRGGKDPEIESCKLLGKKRYEPKGE